MRPALHLDPSAVDCSRVVVDLEAIRKVNPQRFEMEQLTAIVLMDTERQLIAGYKDVRVDEFWVRGHMPAFPLLPGVLMCEAAAQLASYYMVTTGFGSGDFIGFGGLEHVRFRGMVKPGDRFLLIGKVVKLHRRQSILNVQGFVGGNLVFHGEIIGVPISRTAAADAAEE
jgi:3-hydroxyacyl-[acyl-carrier-protein] dehydratase